MKFLYQALIDEDEKEKTLFFLNPQLNKDSWMIRKIRFSLIVSSLTFPGIDWVRFFKNVHRFSTHSLNFEEVVLNLILLRIQNFFKFNETWQNKIWRIEKKMWTNPISDIFLKIMNEVLAFWNHRTDTNYVWRNHSERACDSRRSAITWQNVYRMQWQTWELLFL